MTEGELTAAVASYLELSIGATGIYLTLTSGYLIVAYVAGRNLQPAQLRIINTLYVLMATIIAFASTLFVFRARSFAASIGQPGTILPTTVIDLVTMLWASILVLGEIAALYFMWTTRHTKGE